MPKLRALLLVFVVTSVVAADELRTVDNKTITGTVVSLDAKEVTLKTNDGNVSTPLDNVLALDVRQVKGPGNNPYTEIRLVDETVLICKEKGVAFKGKTVEATLIGGQKITFPLASMVSILKGAQDSTLRKAWDNIHTEKIKRDRVVTYKAGNVNALEGTLGEPDEKGETIPFTWEGDKLTP